MNNEYELLLETLSITIHDHIKELQTDASMLSYRRWVWELLQNAIDLSINNQMNIIRYVQMDNQISFMHNGTVFDQNSLNHLFFKKSSKRDKKKEDRTIGNFGTGFLTTHLLSKLIMLSGVYKQQSGTFVEYNNLHLDRDGTFHDIVDNLKIYSDTRNKIETQKNELVEYAPEAATNTQFVYPLSHELQFEAANLGIQDLKQCLPLTLIFISYLKKLSNVRIQIINGQPQQPLQQQTMVYSLHKLQQIHQELHLFEIKIEKDDVHQQEEIFVFEDRDVQININVLTKLEKKKPEFKLLKRHPSQANLFCVFPLIGTQGFNFPFIINSFDFITLKERNGIILAGPNKELIVQNQKLILNAIDLSQRFIEYVVSQLQSKKQKWKNLHLLADIDLPDNKQGYTDLQWYTENVIRPYREMLFHLPIVEGDDGYRSLSEIKLPFNKGGQEQIFKLAEICKRIFKSDVPQNKQLIHWLDVFQKLPHLWPPNQILYHVEDLVKHISKIKFQNFMWNFQGNEKKGYALLNDLIKIIEQDQTFDLLEKYPMLPNQNRDFRRLSQLFIDEDVPEEYKSIMLSYSESKDWKKFLLDPQIKIQILQNKKTLRDMFYEIQDLQKEVDPQINLIQGGIAFLQIVICSEKAALFKKQTRYLELLDYLYGGGKQYKTLEEQMPENQIEQTYDAVITHFNVQILKNLHNAQKIQNFKLQYEQIRMDEEKKIQDWIYQLIDYCYQFNYGDLLKNLKIFPCRCNIFIAAQDVIINDNLDETLLEYYEQNILIIEQINQTCKAIQEQSQKKIHYSLINYTDCNSIEPFIVDYKFDKSQNLVSYTSNNLFSLFVQNTSTLATNIYELFLEVEQNQMHRSVLMRIQGHFREVLNNQKLFLILQTLPVPQLLLKMINSWEEVFKSSNKQLTTKPNIYVNASQENISELMIQNRLSYLNFSKRNTHFRI